MAHKDDTAGTTGRTAALEPIPGLLLRISVEVNGTMLPDPEEVLTGPDGRLLTTVSVPTGSIVTIEAVNNTIAQLGATGSASEFTRETPLDIVATRMIVPGEACLTIENDGNRYVQFKYNNKNPLGLLASVPVTSLTSPLREYDLRLNSVTNGNGEPVTPEDRYRNVSPNENEQQFKPGDSSFNMLFDPDKAPYIWHFIGDQVTVDSETALCEASGKTGGCTPFDTELIFGLFEKAKKTVIGLTTDIVKAQKNSRGLKGDLRTPYFKLMATLLKRIREITDMPKDSFTCQEVVAGCIRVEIPKDELLKQFDNIFKVKLPKQLASLPKKRAPKARTEYLKKLKALPDAYVYCDNQD